MPLLYCSLNHLLPSHPPPSCPTHDSRTLHLLNSSICVSLRDTQIEEKADQLLMMAFSYRLPVIFSMVDWMGLCEGVLNMREIMQRYANRRESRRILMMTFAYLLLVFILWWIGWTYAKVFWACARWCKDTFEAFPPPAFISGCISLTRLPYTQ